MKISTNIGCTRKAAKDEEIGINDLEIEVQEENYILINANKIISLLQIFYVYMQMLVFSANLSNELQLQLALGRYAEYLIML